MNESLNSNDKKIEIKPVGSYFKTDKDGYLINPTSLEKIQPEYKPAINDVIEIYKKEFGDKLKNVYISGSVAKGEAIKDVSDMDTFAYIDLPNEDIIEDWIKDVNSKLRQKYPFIKNIELKAKPFSKLKNNSFVLNRSLCVYGEKFEISKMKPGKSMVKHVLKLEEKLQLFEERLETNDTDEIKHYCDFFMKEILRSGLDITMERSNRYTRDLYLCYKDFSEYYPDKEPQMREVLNYALNPTSDKTKIRQIKESIVPWLLEESKKYI